MLRFICRMAGLIVLVSILWVRVAGQEAVSAGGIADSIMKGAGVVERLDETEIEILSPRKAIIHHRCIYTILNASGDEYATVHTFYDKFNDLLSATATLFDASGNVLKKISKTDMEDLSMAGSGILMTDTRIKAYRFSCRSYPYSVSFKEDRELNGLFVLPDWRPQPWSGLAVESSRLVVSVPADYPLRYRQYHYPQTVAMSEKGGKKVYSWEERNRPAVREEPFAPSWYRMETSVRLAPGDFEEAGYKGRLYSWADMGRFIGSLYRGRDQLPEEARRQVHALTDGLKDDSKKKIQVLYDFLQKNTHYVGIELGIGGWQPFDAVYVYNKKYGDCKALANYMVALLKEAGIRACNVLVRAGPSAPPIDTGFACSQFNHVIVVAFAGRDSVWLECTSQLLPAGYLGSFTDDRDALMLDGAGTRVVHTPVYGPKENQCIRTVRGNIDDSGALRADVHTDYTGLEQDVVESQIDRFSGRELEEQRQQSLGLLNCTIADLKYEVTRAAVPSIGETIRLSADHFCTLSGNRLILNPALFLKSVAAVHGGGMRRDQLELTTSYQETDTLTLQLPHGYTPEGALPSASYSADFGSYLINGRMRGDTLELICHFRQNKGVYPANTWSGIFHLFNMAHQEGGSELVFVK